MRCLYAIRRMSLSVKSSMWNSLYIGEKKKQQPPPPLSSATHKSTKPGPLQAIHHLLNQAGNLAHRGIKKSVKTKVILIVVSLNCRCLTLSINLYVQYGAQGVWNVVF